MKNFPIHPTYLKQIFIPIFREFLISKGLIEIYTPTLCKSVAIEPELRCFETRSIIDKKTSYLLPTSPEFYLKKMLYRLSKKTKGVFAISNSFRDEHKSSSHAHEFTMIEWYMHDTYYLDFQQQFQELFRFIHTYFTSHDYFSSVNNWNLSVTQKKVLLDNISNIALSYQKIIHYNLPDLFKKTYQQTLSPNASLQELLKVAKIYFPYQTFDNATEIEMFSLLYDYLIQTNLKDKTFSATSLYPQCVSALSKTDKNGWIQRIEFFMNGLEIANGCQELDNETELKKRWQQHAMSLQSPIDQEVLSSCESMQNTSGIALGLERFLMQLFKIPTIDLFSF